MKNYDLLVGDIIEPNRRMSWNCPKCSYKNYDTLDEDHGPLTGPLCENCDTWFDWSEIELFYVD